MFEHIAIRKGQPNHKLSKAEFFEEYKKSFYGEKYRVMDAEIEGLARIAWKDYDEGNKAPVTTKAGDEFHDPNYDLSVEWLETRNRLLKAAEHHKTSPNKILIINGSPRNEHTCPHEISKTFRMIKKAEEVFQHLDTEYEILDLSRVTSEFGKNIYPCKGCVSTSMALCHWPCSCYPNHALNQTSDWMAEIFEMWTRAHGVMIITPVHWYQVPSTLKLMMDRLVCADGGNTDPTTTHGKNPLMAKRLEITGWDYPKHLEGRAFSVVVHGDSIGISDVRRHLTDWLNDLHLIQAGSGGVTESYIGYYKTYAESHYELDKNKNFMTEIETAAASLVRQVDMNRSARYIQPDTGLEHPMQK